MKARIFNLKILAMYSILIYIVLATVFEESKIGMSRYASIGLMICMACCALYIISKRFLRYNWLIISLLLFGGILIISSLYSETSSAIKNMYLYRYFTSVILVWLFFNVVDTNEDVKTVLHGYVIAGTAMALYLYSYYGIQMLLSHRERLGSELGNQNSIGITCASAVIFSIIFLTQNKNKTRWLYIFPIIICIPACMFTGSRKSIILIIICMTFFFLSQNGEKGQIKRFILVVCAVVVGWYLIENLTVFSVIRERFESLLSIFGGNHSRLDVGSENRMRYIREGWTSFLNSPMWGNGFCYSYAKWGVYSHNNYIELLMNNGLIGFVGYYWIHLRLCINALKLNKYHRNMYSVLSIIIITMVLFMDIGAVNYYVRYTLILLTLCCIIMQKTNNHSEAF